MPTNSHTHSSKNVVLKPYGFLDSTALDDLTTALEKEFLGKSTDLEGPSPSSVSVEAKHRPAPLPPSNSVSNHFDSTKRFVEIKNRLKLLRSPKKSSPTSSPGPQTAQAQESPPRIDSYSYRQKPIRRRHVIDENCCFCNLPMQTTFVDDNLESMVELQCQHFAHEQCLALQMELSNTTIECAKCGANAVPISEDVASRLTAQVSKSRASTLSPTPLHLSPASLPKPSSPNPNNHRKKPSRGSQAAANYSTFTSVSERSPSSPQFDVERWASRYSMAELQTKITSELVSLAQHEVIRSNTDQISLTNALVRSFGNLRLVDKLSISTDTDLWTEGYCYLFDHMLVLIDLNAKVFQLLGISQFATVDVPSRWWIRLCGLKPDNAQRCFSCPLSQVLEKWVSALTNLKIEFPNNLVTSTIREDEFYSLIGDPKKAPGVNAALYESTILDDSQPKPASMSILVNNCQPSASSLVSIINIMKSLVMIKIDVTLLLCSSEDLDRNTHLIDRYELDHENTLGEAETLTERINNASTMPPGPVTVKSVLSDLQGSILVVMSNTSLDQLADLPDALLIEVNSTAKQTSKDSKIESLISWEDAMEVICTQCGLEFDDTDFGIISDESDDDSDYDSLGHQADQSLKEKDLSWSKLFNDLNCALEDTGVDIHS